VASARSRRERYEESFGGSTWPNDNLHRIAGRIMDGKLVEMIDYVDTELMTRALDQAWVGARKGVR